MLVRRLRLGGIGAALVLVGAIVLAYANSFSGAFVFDDRSTLLENASIRSLSPLSAVLNPPPEAGVCGRPLANVSFAFNHAVHGLRPAGYHVVNLALHIAAALSLWALLRATLIRPVVSPAIRRQARSLSLLIALLWALHPVNTNAVTYLSQRVEVMMALCYLVTLHAVARRAGGGSAGWTALAIGACAAGMASKEVMITAPVAAWLYDRTFFAGSFREALRRRPGLLAGLAATWLPLAFLMATASLAQRGIGYNLGVSSLEYALTSSRTLLRYLALLVWPQSLVFDYGWTFLTTWREAWPYVTATFAVVASAGWLLVRRPAAGFAAIGFLILLAPTTSVAPIIQQPMAESRLYLPAAAAVALLVGTLTAVAPWTRRAWPALAVAFGALTYARNEDYQSATRLWADTVQKVPDNARAHVNLGVALVEDGRSADAERHFATAVQLRPAYADAHANLGGLLLRRGDVAGALSHLGTAARLDETSVTVRANLGHALVATGRIPEAVAILRALLLEKPGLATAHNDLSVALGLAGDWAGARTEAETAVRLRPGLAEAHFNLGNALMRTGPRETAIQHYREAVNLQPTFARALNNLGVALLQQGRPGEAIDAFTRALSADPGHPDAARNREIARAAASSR